MTEPTYRINTEHKPAASLSYGKWEARVTRLSDGEHVGTRYGNTEANAVQNAQILMIDTAHAPERGSVLFADESGTLLGPPPDSEGD